MINIAPNQLADFKEHAIRLAEAINELEPKHPKIKGRKRVDSLAQAIGYRGHGALVQEVKREADSPDPLRIFEGQEGKDLAQAYAMLTGVHPGTVMAAVTLAGTWLYLFNNEEA